MPRFCRGNLKQERQAPIGAQPKIKYASEIKKTADGRRRCAQNSGSQNSERALPKPFRFRRRSAQRIWSRLQLEDGLKRAEQIEVLLDVTAQQKLFVHHLL